MIPGGSSHRTLTILSPEYFRLCDRYTTVPLLIDCVTAGGARVCIGQNLALMEMSYTVVRILQTFSKLVTHDTTLDKQEGDVGKLFFKNGKESFAWRKSRKNEIGLKVSIVLNPATAIKTRFVKA